MNLNRLSEEDQEMFREIAGYAKEGDERAIMFLAAVNSWCKKRISIKQAGKVWKTLRYNKNVSVARRELRKQEKLAKRKRQLLKRKGR